MALVQHAALLVSASGLWWKQAGLRPWQSREEVLSGPFPSKTLEDIAAVSLSVLAQTLPHLVDMGSCSQLECPLID